MKLQVEVEGTTYDVEVEIVEEPTAGKCVVVPMSPVSGLPDARVMGSAYKRRKLRSSKEDNVCRSPMCGVVVSVNVKQGQFVEEDDVLLVLEAMKMETPIRAALPGHVRTLSVRPGDKVVTGQVLVELAGLTADTGSVE